MTHLWTGGGGGAPSEYLDLIMCRDVYHCPPSVLDEQESGRVLLDFDLHAAERKVEAQKQKKALEKAKKGKRGKR